MKEDKLKGGKSDKLDIADLAKKHDVSVNKIEKQIDMGEKVEKEHVKDKKLAGEIALDHLEEIPDYYTRLDKMEREAKKELNLEAKRFMSLAGIKEGDKKFLNNESFSELDKFPKEEENSDNVDVDDFVIYEFERVDIEPSENDHVYNIRKNK